MTDPAPDDVRAAIVLFDCTIAVSSQGIPVLISKVPIDFYGWIVDGDFPDEDGWRGLPQQSGLYKCRIAVHQLEDQPEVKVVSCNPTTAIMEMVVIQDGNDTTKDDPTPDTVRAAILRAADALAKIPETTPHSVRIPLALADFKLRAAMHEVDVWQAAIEAKSSDTSR